MATTLTALATLFLVGLVPVAPTEPLLVGMGVLAAAGRLPLSADHWRSSRASTVGVIRLSPSTAVRTASTSSGGFASFSRKPDSDASATRLHSFVTKLPQSMARPAVLPHVERGRSARRRTGGKRKCCQPVDRAARLGRDTVGRRREPQVGNRESNEASAMRASTRANGAPTHAWMPWPNARCLFGDRPMSIESGSGHAVTSRLAASNVTSAAAGRSGPDQPGGRGHDVHQREHRGPSYEEGVSAARVSSRRELVRRWSAVDPARQSRTADKYVRSTRARCLCSAHFCHRPVST